MIATELEATWTRNVQASFFVTSFVEEWNLYAADCVNNFLKRAEVDIDVVVNGDSEVLINSVGKRITSWRISKLGFVAARIQPM